MGRARIRRWGLVAIAVVGGYAVLAVCYAQAGRLLAMTGGGATEKLYAAASPGNEISPHIGDRVFFGVGQSALTPRARRRLLEWVVYLKAFPQDTMTLEGHADGRGAAAYNLALGQRRADAVRDFLVDHDIAASRLTAVSYGSTRPAVTGSDETAWAQNRRVVGVVRHIDRPTPAPQG